MSISYPTQYSVVAEDEMVYITGGTDVSQSTTETDPVYSAIMWTTLIGSFVGVIVLIGTINDKRERRLRREYENSTGLPAVDEQGNFTSDFANYKQRAESQGRDKAAGFSVGAANFLADNYRLVVGGALLSAAFLYAKFQND